MQTEVLRHYYRKRGFNPDQTEQAVGDVQELEAALVANGKSLNSAVVGDIEAFVAGLVAAGRNTDDRLRALARYFYLTGNQAIYIYFTALFGSQDVMENIRSRIRANEGEAAAEAIFAGIAKPPLGAPLSEMPAYTQGVMARLEQHLPQARYCALLAGNNHDIPADSQTGERQLLAEAGSLDAYLTDLHRRKVEELQTFCDSGTIWFEQVITQEVVDYVRENPEILSAVRDGRRLYVTKIPYDTVAWLHAQSERERRYYLCHCPFVRSAFLDGRTAVNPNWCYCSGGFTKFPFEVLFDRPLQVELLESPLLGHDRCRFAITLPDDLPL